MFRYLALCLMFSGSLFGQDSVSQQLRTQGTLYTTAADTLDGQAITIATQAARIVELEELVSSLRGDLKNTDFSYVGRVSVPVGMTCAGLAYDPVGGWWYTLGAAGNNPFGLWRFKINLASLSPTTLVPASQTEAIASINTNDVLKMAGQALVQAKGLYWEGNDCLLLNYCSFYNASGANLNVLARYNVVSKTVVGGPWVVDAAVGCEVVKGMTMLSPPKLAQATGLPLISLGVKGSTSQKQSWGFGLVAVDKPTNGQATPVAAKVLSHWPQKIWPGSNPVIPYSDYPGDNNFPVVYLQRAADGSVIKTPMTGSAGVYAGCFLKNKFFFGLGGSGWGYTWYGNQNDFIDVPSLIDPTKMTISPSAARGGHIESSIDKWFLYRVDDLITKFQSGDKLISHYATGRLSELGGGNAVPLQSNSFGQPVEVGDYVYAICHGVVSGANAHILVFKVK